MLLLEKAQENLSCISPAKDTRQSLDAMQNSTGKNAKKAHPLRPVKQGLLKTGTGSEELRSFPTPNHKPGTE